MRQCVATISKDFVDMFCDYNDAIGTCIGERIGLEVVVWFNCSNQAYHRLLSFVDANYRYACDSEWSGHLKD